MFTFQLDNNKNLTLPAIAVMGVVDAFGQSILYSLFEQLKTGKPVKIIVSSRQSLESLVNKKFYGLNLGGLK